MLDTKQVEKDLRKGERQRSHFLEVQLTRVVMHTACVPYCGKVLQLLMSITYILHLALLPGSCVWHKDSLVHTVCTCSILQVFWKFGKICCIVLANLHETANFSFVKDTCHKPVLWEQWRGNNEIMQLLTLGISTRLFIMAKCWSST